MEYKFSVVLRWQISKSIKVVCAFFALTHHFKDITVFDLARNRSRSQSIIFHNVVFRLQIPKSTKVIPCIFARALTVSEILTYIN